jgi:hypothetical protein
MLARHEDTASLFAEWRLVAQQCNLAKREVGAEGHATGSHIFWRLNKEKLRSWGDICNVDTELI